jgi:biopolymer transport protein ExbB/biopolymer transport protein TolQ
MLIQKLLAVAEITGQAVLYLLLALSVISIGIIAERWIWFRRRRVNARALGRALVEKVRAGDVKGAIGLCEKERAVEADVLKEALGWWDHGTASVEQVLAGGVQERRKAFESGLLFLGTLGNNAPFIGLFGTVLGIVTAFRELGANAAGGAMGNVMTAIAEALVATAIGILVALPAVIAYNVFQKKTQDVEDNVRAIGTLLLAQMKSAQGKH